MSPFVKGQKPYPRKNTPAPSEVTTMQTAQERPTRDIPVARTPRPERTPLGQRNRLTFKQQDPNYHYRWLNDVDDRLQLALEGGYEFVIGDAKLAGDSRLESTPLDGRISKPAGNGIQTYLMRIPREFYEADQAAKAQRIDETEAAMKPDKAKGQYGDGLTKD